MPIARAPNAPYSCDRMKFASVNSLSGERTTRGRPSEISTTGSPARKLYATTPPASGAPRKASSKRTWNMRSPLTCVPSASANRANIAPQAPISFAPLLQCTIATGSPAGVATTSISICTCSSGRSSTTIAKILVPALTFPVRGLTAPVATIPVPASPSGGHSGMPDSRRPLGSRSAAPARVRAPAARPAGSTSGSTPLTGLPSAPPASESNFPSFSMSKASPLTARENMPEASPTPSTRLPVSFQCT